MIYVKYLKYVFLHKWFVLLECWKLGLIWQGIVHDLSKLRLDELRPYARYFYGDIKKSRDETGYYKPTDTGDAAFDFAWLLHQKRNPHHWQWWILPEDEGGLKILPMQRRYVLEMICDWRGAGRAQGHGDDTIEWYRKHRHVMQLHSDTQQTIERLLGISA
jgi:hypothetical protein